MIKRLLDKHVIRTKGVSWIVCLVWSERDWFLQPSSSQGGWPGIHTSQTSLLHNGGVSPASICFCHFSGWFSFCFMHRFFKCVNNLNLLLTRTCRLSKISLFFFFLTFNFVLGNSQLTICDSFRWIGKGLSHVYACIHSPSNTPLPSRLPHKTEQSSTIQ